MQHRNTKTLPYLAHTVYGRQCRKLQLWATLYIQQHPSLTGHGVFTIQRHPSFTTRHSLPLLSIKPSLSIPYRCLELTLAGPVIYISRIYRSNPHTLGLGTL